MRLKGESVMLNGWKTKKPLFLNRKLTITMHSLWRENDKVLRKIQERHTQDNQLSVQ